MIGPPPASSDPVEPDRWEPSPPEEPPAAPPFPAWNEPDADAAPRPDATPAWADTPRAARIEPWSPDADPWRFEPDVVPSADPGREAEAVSEPEPWPPEPDQSVAAEPEPDLAPEPVLPSEPDRDAVGEPLISTTADPEATEVRPVARWPARSEELPDWLVDAEPETESWRAAPSSRVHEDTTAEPSALRAEPGVASAPDLEPEAEPPLDAEAEREMGPDRGTAAMPLEDPEPPSVPFWKSILPWRSAEADDGADADADAHREATAELEPEADPEVEPEADPPATPSDDVVAAPVVEPRWPASVPEPAGDLAIDAEPDGAAPEREPAWRDDGGETGGAEPPTMIPLTGGLTYDTLERWPGPDLAQAPPVAPDRDREPMSAADVSDVEPWPAPQPWPAEAERQWEPHPEPEPEPRYELEPEPEPQPEPTAWSEPEWADRGESTRVLPTDWTPQQPDRGTAQPELSAGEIRTRLADPDADMDQAEPAGTVAEQAVPWLIGVILLLAGMVIVLLALIFAGDGSLGGAGAGEPTPSPTLAALVPTVSASPSPSQSAAATTSATPAPSGTAEPTPTTAAAPEYGPLEMVYQGRSAALAPIYLLRRDFTVDGEPDVLAQDASIDVRRFAWAPDGRVGAGLLADVLVSIEPGKEKRRLGDGLSTITFGADGSTIYGVRITEDGDEDVATVVSIDFESGDTEDLASVTYERPEAREAAALAEAQFTDDGGPVRIVWTADDRLHLWVRGAGAWDVDPAEGAATELEGGSLPVLWSPNGQSRVEVTRDDGTTTLTLRNRNERAMASTQVDGLVSHLRWSPASDRVVFTLGRSASGGGILQDLYLWDLGNGEAPMQLTNTGAAFGTEWLGTRPQWRGG